jgi:hypothetical protein
VILKNEVDRRRRNNDDNPNYIRFERLRARTLCVGVNIKKR